MSTLTGQAAADVSTPPASEPHITNRTWISEGLLIASAPVAAYAVTLSYMVGFAGFFRIPGAFLSVNIGTMFSTAGDLWAPAALILWLFCGAYFLMPRKEHPIAEKWAVILPVVAILVLKLIMFGTRWREWLGTLLSLVLFATFLFRRTVPAHVSFGDRRLYRYVQTVTFQKLLTLYLFAYVALTVSHDVGRAAAMFQQEYLVPTNWADAVVLSSFGDNLIVAAFDRKAKEVEPGFSILKKGEDPKLVLRWERVGPLHLKPEPQSEPPPTGTQPSSRPSAKTPPKSAPPSTTP